MVPPCGAGPVAPAARPVAVPRGPYSRAVLRRRCDDFDPIADGFETPTSRLLLLRRLPSLPDRGGNGSEDLRTFRLLLTPEGGVGAVGDRPEIADRPKSEKDIVCCLVNKYYAKE